jgi:predicted Kef-type K+ transport protein
MLFDPAVLLEKPLHVLGVVAIIILGKSLAAAALVMALRYPLNTALTVAAAWRRSASSRSFWPAWVCRWACCPRKA